MNMYTKFLSLLALPLLLIGLLSKWPHSPSPRITPATKPAATAEAMAQSGFYHPPLAQDLPEVYNDLFAGSGVCMMCHNEQVDAQGNPIPIVDHWRSTMMANSARDPFWRAKVSHEGLVNPGHKEELENLCTRCHAPAGQVNAHFLGQSHYTITEMENDPLALDGVQCTVCHQITESSLGNYSGQFQIGENQIIWGQYPDPLTGPMMNHTGYTPTQGIHIMDAALCGSCHTLITQSVDNEGNPTGNEFVEQAVYHEWLNSKYPAEQTTCQSCHMPRIDDPVIIASMPPWLNTERSPYGLHTFPGANVFMLNMLKNYATELNLTATPQQFDASIAINRQMLQEQTLDITLSQSNRTADTLFLSLFMQNKAGHKFPSGYPSRRFFVELIVTDLNGNELFHSGAMDDNHQLLHEDSPYEPHYDLITSEEQVQIYELVMGDINHEFTTVLERANFALKDNRLPPQGFTSSHSAYDTVQIVGAALQDPNFNKTDTWEEGSGTDELFFHIPLNGYNGSLNITAKIHYQTVPEKWLEEMFSYSSAEIDQFKTFYQASDKTPVLVAEANLLSVATEEIWPTFLHIKPTITSGPVQISSSADAFRQINVYTPSGKRINSFRPEGSQQYNFQLQLPKEKGIYLIEVATAQNRYLKKVVVQ